MIIYKKIYKKDNNICINWINEMDNKKINSYKAKKYTSEIHKIFPQCLTKIIIRKKKKKTE